MKRTLALLLVLLAGPPVAHLAAQPAAAPLTVLAYETPRFFFRGPDGKPAGIEHEILEFYARTKGRPLAVTWTDEFDTILSRIESGEAEIGACTLTVTPERRQRVAFSTSYFPTRVMLVEPRSQSTGKLSELAGATVAAIKGSTYEQLLTAIPRARMLYGIDEDELLAMVASGRARAAAVDSAIALTLLPKYPGLRLGIPLSAEQGFGFAVRKGSPLEAELSKHILQLKESKIYFRILEKHLGAEAAALVAAGRS